MAISWSGFTEGENFHPEFGLYNYTTNSQSSTLTVGANATSHDAIYTCTVASKMYPESDNKSVEVELNVYGKFIHRPSCA